MDGLRDILDDIDQLHRDSSLDVRHRERFLRKLQWDWPRISQRLRDALNALRHPPPKTCVAYLGTIDHCRQIGRAVVDEWQKSDRDGVIFYLTRNRQSEGPGSDFRICIGYTGDPPAT